MSKAKSATEKGITVAPQNAKSYELRFRSISSSVPASCGIPLEMTALAGRSPGCYTAGEVPRSVVSDPDREAAIAIALAHRDCRAPDGRKPCVSMRGIVTEARESGMREGRYSGAPAVGGRQF